MKIFPNSFNELPCRKQRGIISRSLRSYKIFRPKGRGIRPIEIEGAIIIMEYKDINSDLCTICGECCKISFTVQGDKRYFAFLERVGYEVIKDEIDENIGLVEIGYCKHMEQVENKFICKIYDDRPELCKDYNCLAWASYSNRKDKSKYLARALEIHSKLVKQPHTN